jgi:hypothetical protein
MKKCGEMNPPANQCANRNSVIEMTSTDTLDQFVQADSVVTMAVSTSLRDPAKRRELYKRLVNTPMESVAPLLRQAFIEEVKYRDALWNCEIKDEGDYSEGIYHCAFLLYCLKKVEDLPILWRAKYLNMDVGCSMGAEFFVGAGMSESLAFAEHGPNQELLKLADYIRGHFEQPEAMMWQKKWEDDMRASICDA